MKRPMVFITLLYIAGVLSGYYIQEPKTLFVIECVLTILVCGFAYRFKKLIWMVIVPFFLFGAYMINVPDIYPNFDGEITSLKGIVSDIYLTDYNTQFLTVDASEITVNNTVYSYNKKISVIADEPAEIYWGQKVSAVGTASKLNFKRNPGSFSEEGYMRTRGFGGKLEKAIITPGEMEKPYIYIMRKSVQSVSKSLHRVLPEDMADIMGSLMLGERGAIDDDIRENFRKTGVSHILSISGLHLSIIAGLMLMCFKYAGLRLRGSALVTIFILWTYCFFSGASVSTVRAVIMLSVLLSGYLLYRTADIYSSVSLAALIILMRIPLFLWDAGFLLSFSAVIGIGFLTPKISPYLKHLDYKGVRVSSYLGATLSATIFTMPVCAYFFYYVSISGLLANALILPLATLLVEAGFLFIVLQAFFVSSVLASIIYTILLYFIKVTEVLANLPLSYVVTGQPSIFNIMLYYAAVIITALYMDAWKNEKGTKHMRLLMASGACVAIVFAALNAKKIFPQKEMEIVFLDVGQGDAAVLHLPENIDIMIDAGGNILREIGDNTGVNVVIPYLRYRGIGKLDAVFLTHPDLDHCAGVIELMEYYKIGRLFISDIAFDDEVFDMVMEAAEANGVPVTKVKKGYGASVGGARIDCIYPVYSGKPKNINGGSLTLKITYGDSVFLFTGDIEKNDDEKILLSGVDIKSDVLKVPHHGSDTSSTPEFVSAVSPDYALVGAGKNNAYGHPAPVVVETYLDNGVTLYNTAETGAVFLVADGETIITDTMREREARRWSD